MIKLMRRCKSRKENLALLLLYVEPASCQLHHKKSQLQGIYGGPQPLADGFVSKLEDVLVESMELFTAYIRNLLLKKAKSAEANSTIHSFSRSPLETRRA